MKFLKIRDVKTPTRGTSKSAGIDFYVPNDFKKCIVRPGDNLNIPSGIKANVPEGYALIAFNKSGVVLKKGLQAGACVVDEDYQGEIHINVINITSNETMIEPGEKLIQFLCLPINYVSVELCKTEEELYEGTITERGEGGFGSTGIQ